MVLAGARDDLLDASLANDNNQINGGSRDDTFIFGHSDLLINSEGVDRFFVGTGSNNTLSGGEEADQFGIATAELPDSANTITDFVFEALRTHQRRIFFCFIRSLFK